jgi:ABC-type transport system involved in Fe-S cluster assembly fused permease/ATPase subunit
VIWLTIGSLNFFNICPHKCILPFTLPTALKLFLYAFSWIYILLLCICILTYIFWGILTQNMICIREQAFEALSKLNPSSSSYLFQVRGFP